MPVYAYKARNVLGKPVKGTIDAATKEEVIDKLHKTGCMVTQVTETITGVRIETLFDKLGIISAEDIIMFNIQLSNMISAGITILNSLEAMSQQIEKKRLKKVINTVSRSIESGDTFSQALARHPKIFPPIFVNMVKAGEASGRLDTILSRYALFAEQQEDLRQKIRGALFYPVILLIAGIAVTLFIVTTIIPQFVEIFVRSGVKLPVLTLVLYKVGMAIKNFWHVAALAVIAISAFIKYYYGTKKGRPQIDRFKLNMPVIGSLFKKASLSRFSRTLGTLLGSGVPILQSLDIVRDVVGNEVLASSVGSVRNSVEKGSKIAEPMKISGEFPQDMIQMVSVGEETGSLDIMLNKISDFYDMSLGYTIKKLTVIIEPVFLVVMGSMVGFIMASMLLPIFDMVKILRH